MEKLTPKELAPYMPYGLRMKTNHGWDTMFSLNYEDGNINEGYEDYYYLSEIKPVLRPLSDLTIENMKDFSGGNFKRYSEDFLHSILETYKRDIKTQKISYNLMQPLIENHFDVFGLIDKNLAVPVTEEFNPYK